MSLIFNREKLLVPDDPHHHTSEMPLRPQRPRLGLPSSAQHGRSDIDHRPHGPKTRAGKQQPGVQRDDHLLNLS